MSSRIPPRLRPGSRVALVSPAGPVAPEAIEAGLRRCTEWGLDPVLGPNASAHHGFLAGPDEARLSDLRSALSDPSIDAVWALRGGYGTMRLLDALDASALRTRPKAYIGFSDNTALHARLGKEGVVTFHGPHAGGAFPAFTEACFRRVLFTGETGALPFPEENEPPRPVVGGRATGILAGGNLTMLAGLCGTRWAPDLRDRILVVEDVGEAAYRLDRAWTQLRLAGCLDGVRGVVLGSFTNRPERPGERPFEEVLREFVEPLGVPAFAGAPVGHIDRQWTLPLGLRVEIDADAPSLALLEHPVA